MTLRNTPIHPRTLVLVAAAGLLACADSSGPVGPGPVAELSVVSGAGQTGRVGSELPGEVVVRAVDGAGRATPGVALTFEVVSGGGSAAAASSQTNEAGEARTRWTLGPSAGEQSLRIRAGGTAGGPVVEAIVSATAQPGPLASLGIVTGDAQSGAVGVALPQDLVVRALDSHGNAIAGQLVQFVVESGDGDVTPALVPTDAQGRAQARWTLGTGAGAAQALRAVGVPAGNPPIQAVFTATAVAGPPQQVTRVSGNEQTGDPGVALGQPLRVRVTDRYGNPIAGAPVTWSATGGGSVAPAGPSTDAAGHAEATWTLGAAAGQAATASAAGSQAVFTATLNPPGPLAALTIVEGNGQSGAVGQELPLPLGVRATDAQGRPIAGHLVVFEVTAGGGSMFLRTAVTGANGEARDRWTLGTSASAAQAVEARAMDPTTGAAHKVAFSATPRAGPPERTLIIRGDGQSAQFGSLLPTPLEVRVVDVYNNRVPGVTVAWTVTSGGGTTEPSAVTTGADGHAQTRWTLGPAGAQQVQAVAGPAGATFSATGFVPPPGWTVLPNMPVAVRSAGAAVVNGAIHVLGGYSSGFNDSHQVYDIATGSWRTAAPLPERLDNPMVVATPAGLHLMGGSVSNGTTRRHWIYDASANAWTAAPDLPTPRRAGVAWFVDGRIYLLGGLVNVNTRSVDVDIYDVAARTWTTAATPMPSPSYHAGAALVDGEIIVAGGIGPAGVPVALVSAFDPQTGTWSEREPLPEPVSAFAFGLLAGRLCVFGGAQAGRDTVWCRLTGSSGWQDIGTMLRTRGEMAHAVLGDAMYLFGGGRNTSFSAFADRIEPFQ